MDAAQQTKPLGAVLKAILGRLSGEPKKRNMQLADCWPRVIGERFASRTRPVLRQNNMTVWVETSTLAFELSQHYGPAILKRLQNELGEDAVKKIWFRVGSV